MLPCFPCSSPWESNVFPHTKGGSSEICQESGECVCWTCEETSLGGFGDNGAWAPAVVYFVHAKHFTRTRGNSRSEQRHNISLSYWKAFFIFVTQSVGWSLRGSYVWPTGFHFFLETLPILRLQTSISFSPFFFIKLNLLFICFIILLKWRSYYLTDCFSQKKLDYSVSTTHPSRSSKLKWMNF